MGNELWASLRQPALQWIHTRMRSRLRSPGAAGGARRALPAKFRTGRILWPKWAAASPASPASLLSAAKQDLAAMVCTGRSPCLGEAGQRFQQAKPAGMDSGGTPAPLPRRPPFQPGPAIAARPVAAPRRLWPRCFAPASSCRLGSLMTPLRPGAISAAPARRRWRACQVLSFLRRHRRSRKGLDLIHRSMSDCAIHLMGRALSVRRCRFCRGRELGSRRRSRCSASLTESIRSNLAPRDEWQVAMSRGSD